MNYGSGSDSGAYFFMSRRFAQQLLPECYLLCQEKADDGGAAAAATAKGRGGSASARGPTLEQLLSDLAVPGATLGKDLQDLQSDVSRRVEEQLRLYEERVVQELDPETAGRIQQAQGETLRYEEALEGLRQQIDNEKGLQESILREFRSQLGRSSKPGGGGRATPAPQHNPPGSPGRPSSRPGTAGHHVH